MGALAAQASGRPTTSSLAAHLVVGRGFAQDGEHRRDAAASEHEEHEHEQWRASERAEREVLVVAVRKAAAAALA